MHTNVHQTVVVFPDTLRQEIGIELAKAIEKHPHWPKNLNKAVLILTEEAGEVAKAALQFQDEGLPKSKLREEIIQTAAMCIRLLQNLHKYENTPNARS